MSLQKAKVQLKLEVNILEKRLDAAKKALVLLGEKTTGRLKRRGMAPAVRAKIRAAAKRRWALYRAKKKK